MPAATSSHSVFHRLDRTGSVPKPTAKGKGTGTGTPTLHRLEFDIAHPLNTAIHHVGVAGVCQHALDQETRFLSNTSW
jgi:hypothetical protein